MFDPFVNISCLLKIALNTIFTCFIVLKRAFHQYVTGFTIWNFKLSIHPHVLWTRKFFIKRCPEIEWTHVSPCSEISAHFGGIREGRTLHTYMIKIRIFFKKNCWKEREKYKKQKIKLKVNGKLKIKSQKEIKKYSFCWTRNFLTQSNKKWKMLWFLLVCVSFHLRQYSKNG